MARAYARCPARSAVRPSSFTSSAPPRRTASSTSPSRAAVQNRHPVFPGLIDYGGGRGASMRYETCRSGPGIARRMRPSSNRTSSSDWKSTSCRCPGAACCRRRKESRRGRFASGPVAGEERHVRRRRSRVWPSRSSTAVPSTNDDVRGRIGRDDWLTRRGQASAPAPASPEIAHRRAQWHTTQEVLANFHKRKRRPIATSSRAGRLANWHSSTHLGGSPAVRLDI